LPQFSSPLPNTSTEYVLQQDFMQFRANFSALALNTAHPSSGLTPDYSAFKLVAEGERRDMGGGIVRWTRTYAKVPDNYSDWESYSYPFIGMTTLQPDGTLITRLQQAWLVSTRLQHDFFLTGTGGSYSTPGDIPIIMAQVYVFQTTWPTSAILGGIVTETQSLNPAAAVVKTWPTSEQYNAMISDALTNSWSATVSSVVLYNDNTISGPPGALTGHMAGAVNTGSSVLGGQIAVETSKIIRWQGNIWERTTRYALAQ
jgi:hypothetical protein